jgi:hypothetical protein
MSPARIYHRKTIMERKVCVLICSTTFVWYVSQSKEELRRILSQMLAGIRVKYPLFLSGFSETWTFFDGLSKNKRIPNSIKIRPSAGQVRADGLTDRHGGAHSRFSEFLRMRLITQRWIGLASIPDVDICNISVFTTKSRTGLRPISFDGS